MGRFSKAPGLSGEHPEPLPSPLSQVGRRVWQMGRGLGMEGWGQRCCPDSRPGSGWAGDGRGPTLGKQSHAHLRSQLPGRPQDHTGNDFKQLGQSSVPTPPSAHPCAAPNHSTLAGGPQGEGKGLCHRHRTREDCSSASVGPGGS